MSDLVYTPNLAETNVAPQRRVNVRPRLVAAALSALIPGWGQFRLGHRRAGSALIGALIIFLICFWPLRLPRYYAGLIALGLDGLVLFSFAVFHALFSRDRESGGRLRLRWLPAGLVFVYLGFNITFTSALIGSGFRALQVMGSAMDPLVRQSERLIYDRRYYRSRAVLRGDVVVVCTNDNVRVRRVIAIAGDTIEGSKRTILLNSKPLDEPFVWHKYPPGSDPAMDTFGPVTVPAGKYFVMGDNRDISIDSRLTDFGLVSDDAILGRTLYFYKVGFGSGPPTRQLN